MITLEEFFTLIKLGEIDQVKELLDEDPELVNARDIEDMSAVMAAVYYQRWGIVQLLITCGAQLDIFEACAAGREERVRDLLEEDPAQVNAIADDGFHPLELACFFGHYEIAELLLEYGASVDEPSHNPMEVMPLHSAVASQSLEIVRLLLEHGAPVNARQSEDFTPLHAAAQNGDLEIMHLLLAYGADPDARDVEGKTPLWFAEAEGHQAAADLLRASTRKIE